MNEPAISNPQRVALIVEYDGSCFHGWQLQSGQPGESVQQVLEAAIGSVADAQIRVHCAGRTDAGVHATHQVVHFDSPNARETQSWLRGINANLPATVSVRHAHMPGDSFHARFSAVSRQYRYLIYNRAVRNPHLRNTTTWVRQPLEAALMHEAAQALLGERDFSAFRAAACQSSTPMRRMDYLNVDRRDDLVVIDLQANAFLHHMVRNIVGSLIVVGKGQAETAWLSELMDGRDRSRAGDTAAASGLYLVGVDYPEEFAVPMLPPGPAWLG